MWRDLSLRLDVPASLTRVSSKTTICLQVLALEIQTTHTCWLEYWRCVTWLSAFVGRHVGLFQACKWTKLTVSVEMFQNHFLSPNTNSWALSISWYLPSWFLIWKVSININNTRLVLRRSVFRSSAGLVPVLSVSLTFSVVFCSRWTTTLPQKSDDITVKSWTTVGHRESQPAVLSKLHLKLCSLVYLRSRYLLFWPLTHL